MQFATGSYSLGIGNISELPLRLYARLCVRVFNAVPSLSA